MQILSRLNRAHPIKHDVFVLDFLNDTDTIRDSFADFYRATILAEETDPNKLHDLQSDWDGAQVYSAEQIDDFVTLYLGGAERDQLDPILDPCVAVYLSDLDDTTLVSSRPPTFSKGCMNSGGLSSQARFPVSINLLAKTIFSKG